LESLSVTHSEIQLMQINKLALLSAEVLPLVMFPEGRRQNAQRSFANSSGLGDDGIVWHIDPHYGFGAGVVRQTGQQVVSS
jgi:hypothetical protein